MKIKKLIILILIIAAFGAGIYFKDDVFNFYNNFSKGVQDFKKTDIGNLISQAQKEFLAPPPLNIGGKANEAVLLKSKIIEETNLQRKTRGLPALIENVKLDEAAGVKVNDMFFKQYFEHVSPSGTGPGTLVKNSGYDYIVAGENLILGNFSSEKEVIQNWMESPGHKANILNIRYSEIGVAIVKGTFEGKTVWIGVQEFGLPLSSCKQPDTSLRDKIESQKTQLDYFSAQIELKRKEIETIDPELFRYNAAVDAYNQLVKDYNVVAENTKGLILQYNNQVNNFNECVAGGNLLK